MAGLDQTNVVCRGRSREVWGEQELVSIYGLGQNVGIAIRALVGPAGGKWPSVYLFAVASSLWMFEGVRVLGIS